MPPSISLQKRLLIFIIAIGAAAVLIIIFIIYPCIRQIISLQKSVSATEQYLEEQYGKTQYLRRSIRELNKISQDIKKMENIGVRKGEELSLITQVEQTAEINRIDQKLTVNYDEAKSKTASPSPLSSRPRYRLTFVNTGLFADQLKYFQALELLPYYIIIDSIQLEKGRGAATSSTPITARFNAIVYEISS
jgi:hypothetical protein